MKGFNVINSVLNWILKCNGSQCSAARTEQIHSVWLVLPRSHAGAFWSKYQCAFAEPFRHVK